MTVTARAGALDDVAPYPIPVGRGRWRITIHARDYQAGGFNVDGQPANATQLAELFHARSRRIEREWCKSATITFTVAGDDPAAPLVKELQTEAFAWRWDDWAGRDVCVGRFIIDHSQDVISEQAHAVVFSGHDYIAMLERRRIVAVNTYDATESQDRVVENLVYSYAVNSGHNANDPTQGTFLPGSYLPLAVARANPDGTPRTTDGPQRTRSYEPGAEVFALIDDLSKVINGFEYDLCPMPEVPAGYSSSIWGANKKNKDAFRVFYPTQGVERDDVALVYGGNVAALSRTVSSADYANRVWAVGNNQSHTVDPGYPLYQMFSDKYNASASQTAGGLWMDVLNAPDVNVQATLDEQAQGAVALAGVLRPSYSLTLRPGSYRYGFPNIGDTVPVIVQSGRLDVDTTQRIMAITYDIGDDGDETVGLTVGQPTPSLGRNAKRQRDTLDALNRK
jgi:hypothetical protein